MNRTTRIKLPPAFNRPAAASTSAPTTPRGLLKRLDALEVRVNKLRQTFDANQYVQHKKYSKPTGDWERGVRLRLRSRLAEDPKRTFAKALKSAVVVDLEALRRTSVKLSANPTAARSGVSSADLSKQLAAVFARLDAHVAVFKTSFPEIFK